MLHSSPGYSSEKARPPEDDVYARGTPNMCRHVQVLARVSQYFIHYFFDTLATLMSSWKWYVAK